MLNNRYSGHGFFKSKSPLYADEEKSTLHFTLLVPNGFDKEANKGRWRYVSYVAYGKLAKALNDTVNVDDFISLEAVPVTVRRQVEGKDDIFTQYLSVRQFSNVSNMIEKYKTHSIHDLSDEHIDIDDEASHEESVIMEEEIDAVIEHGKTSMFIEADEPAYEMDDFNELEPEI